MATLCNHWAEDRDVTLITLDSRQADFYALDARVDRISLDLLDAAVSRLAGLPALLKRVARLSLAIESSKPDVVVSFMDKTNILAAFAGSRVGIPVFVCERAHAPSQPLPFPWSILRHFAYRQAARIVVQSKELVQWASGFGGREKVVVIPNPLAPQFAVSGPTASIRDDTIVGVGRLSHEKGFDLLVRAFARARPAHPAWRLVIYGEGPEREALQRLARSLAVEGSFELPGVTQNICAVFSAAGLFVLPSRREGFPNALVEAMASGCAVIAADCLTGPREIITDGEDGVLVAANDVDALALSLTRLMTQPALRTHLGAAAQTGAEKYELGRVAKLWDSTFLSVASGLGNGHSLA
ncbi:MAG: hypothetical protein JWM95_4248 [Gemmatimonadetes bacterium]|nr:hypothetical protein [Gemmatimonadota bacterium]